MMMFGLCQTRSNKEYSASQFRHFFNWTIEGVTVGDQNEAQRDVEGHNHPKVDQNLCELVARILGSCKKPNYESKN